MMPFEINVPYRMRPNMRLLQSHEPITYQDNFYSLYIKEKEKIMSCEYGDNWNRSWEIKVLNYLQCYSITEAIKSYQEDIVFWAPNSKGNLSIQMASVCFPSGWDPKEKINKTFFEIHEPVAENELIQKSSNHIAKLITEKGPFIRSVWTVSNSNELNRHPSVKRKWSNETFDDMYYRCERQVTVPLGDSALFFIRTYIVPLVEVNYVLIKDSINSMSDEILSYKDLHHVKKVLNGSVS